MPTFRWFIREEKNHINPPIRLLNEALGKTGGSVSVEHSYRGACLLIELDDHIPAVGRPRIPSKKDWTIAQIQHARFLNVPMAEIAQSLGVSVRTLYRRWDAATKAHLHPDTPYSKWP